MYKQSNNTINRLTKEQMCPQNDRIKAKRKLQQKKQHKLRKSLTTF